MALIKCPECGRQISDKAVSCPQCGYPVTSSTAQVAEAAPAGAPPPKPIIETPAPASAQVREPVLPDPLDVKAAEDVLKSAAIRPNGRWSESVSGKLRIEGSQVLLKKRKQDHLIFDLSSVSSLEHKGSKLLARTGETFFIIDFMVFGKEAQRRKELLAKVMGVQLPPKPPEINLKKVKKLIQAGVFVAALGAAAVFSIIDDKGTEDAGSAEEETTEQTTAEKESVGPSREEKLEMQMRAGTHGPLHEAAMIGDLGTVRRLLRQGTDVNERGEYGCTALFYAATACDQPDFVRFLLQSGAKVDIPGDGGDTPLMVAASTGCITVVKLLVSAGADVNAMNDGDETPLFGATAAMNYSGNRPVTAQWNPPAVVRFLKSKGAVEEP